MTGAAADEPADWPEAVSVRELPSSALDEVASSADPGAGGALSPASVPPGDVESPPGETAAGVDGAGAADVFVFAAALPADGLFVVGRLTVGAFSVTGASVAGTLDRVAVVVVGAAVVVVALATGGVAVVVGAAAVVVVVALATGGAIVVDGRSRAAVVVGLVTAGAGVEVAPVVIGAVATGGVAVDVGAALATLLDAGTKYATQCCIFGSAPEMYSVRSPLRASRPQRKATGRY